MHTSFLLFGAELDSKGTVVNECPVDIQSRSLTEPAGENRILVPPQQTRESAPRPSPQAKIESWFRGLSCRHPP